MGLRGIAPPIRDLDIRLRSADNLQLPPLYPRYSLYRRLGGPQSWSGHFEEEKNLLPLRELEHTIVELAAEKEYFYFNPYSVRKDSVNFIQE